MRENPFITEFAGVPVEDVLRAHAVLDAGSGGYWLGRVRYELNLRQVWHRDLIRKSVGPHAWEVIAGRRQFTRCR